MQRLWQSDDDDGDDNDNDDDDDEHEKWNYEFLRMSSWRALKPLENGAT